MSRTENSQLRASLAGKELVAADLIKFHTIGCSDPKWSYDQSVCVANGETYIGELCYTTFDSDIVTNVDGQLTTFKATEELANLPEVEEVLGLEVTTIEITLLAIDNPWLDWVQRNEFMNKKVTLWRALLDPEDYSILLEGQSNNPFMWFSGHIVDVSFEKSENGEGSSVTFEIANAFYDYERTNGIVCNVESHQSADDRFKDDTGFQFCVEYEVKLPWMDD